MFQVFFERISAGSTTRCVVGRTDAKLPGEGHLSFLGERPWFVKGEQGTWLGNLGQR